MPLAHICPVCGGQLARNRAVADAVYSLPIVFCPCGYASVRRRHPLLARWRAIRAAVRSVVFLIVHMLILAGLSLANAGFIGVLQRDLRRDLDLSPGAFVMALFNPSGGSWRLQSWLDDGGGKVFLIGFAVVAIAVGIWLRAALAHWRWPRPLFAGAILASGWLWMESLCWPLDWFYGRMVSQPAVYSGPDTRDSIQYLVILAFSLGVSAAAAPIGRAVSRGLAWSRQRRFIKILNKRRKARRGE